MAAIPQGHALKIRRAKEHLEWIAAYLQPWVDGNKHAEWLQRDQVIPGNTCVMAQLSEQPGTYPLAVEIGECLHNMRSALDLLAYELAAAYTDPLPNDIAESSEFPIFGDEDGAGNSGVGFDAFHRVMNNGLPARGSGLYKTRGVDPVAQARIEGLQPYKRGAAFREDPLWMLHELDRINKHRVLHVIATSGVFTLRIGEGYDPARDYPFIGDIRSFSGTVVGNKATRIGSFTLRPDVRKEEMKVHLGTTIAVVIDDVPALATAPDIFKGPPVIDTLTEIFNYLTTEVLAVLAP